MKNKSIIIIIGIIILILGIFLFLPKETEKTDAVKFKEEYESLNNTKSSSGKDIRNLTIQEDNPIIYSSAEEVVEMINNKESFAVYFGFSSCPWCRSVLPTLFEVMDDLKIDKIYYVDVKDIRDVLTLDENQKVKTEKKGTDAYYELLKKLDSVLSDYQLTTEENEKIETGEKRIYAPNIVSIIDGKVHDLTTGISDSQTDGYMELTKEMQKETYEKIKCVLDCLSEEEMVCTKKSC